MEKEKIKAKLQVKRVTLDHLDQFNELLRYVFQVTNQDLLDGGYADGELIQSKRPLLERADAFGWFNEETLISLICIYPCRVNVHGRIFEMGGLTGVGTYPEYAGMGLMHDLIQVGLKKMRQRGQLISYLYPYSIPFYRHRGWEILSDQITFTVKDYQLPKVREVPGFVERRPIDHPDVFAVYDRFAHKTHGAMIRNSMDWKEYWRWENEDERLAAVYYNDAHEPTGLVFYWIQNDVLHIKEMNFLNQEARRGLWNFISAHHSMIDVVKGHNFKNEPLAFYLEDSQIVETLEPYFMARIVDVQAFLEHYPFTEFYRPLHFEVTDSLAEWNTGIFAVAGVKNGKNIIVNEPLGHRVKLDIRTLTALLMHYRRPSFFAELEQMHTSTDNIKLLEAIIPSQRPYFSDYF